MTASPTEVRLQRTDGRTVTVPLSRLSAEDREFVEQWRKRQPPASSGPAPAPATASPSVNPASIASAPGTNLVINMLSLIDVNRDQVRGSWTKQQTSLLSPAGLGVFRLPVPPPPSYRLTVVAERLDGSDSLNIGLVVDRRQTMLVLDGWGAQASGLNLVDGQTGNDNATTHRGRIFQPGRPATIVCTVQPDSVQATVDGQMIVNWTGAASRLSLDRRFWPDVPSSLVLASFTSPFRIDRVELEPVFGGIRRNLPSGLADGRVQTPSPGFGPRPPAAGQPASVVPNAGLAGRSLPGASRVLRGGSRLSSGTPPPLGPAQKQALGSVVLVEHKLASGSGFVVGPNLVATNAHVVDGACPDEIKVQYGSEADPPRPVSRVLYFDDGRDLCLLEAEVQAPPLPVRSDYVLQAEDQVVLMGNPAVKGGIVLRNAVNHGKLSALVRIEGHDFYQIDASVDHGWSGGPVLDADGRVIAVVARKADDRTASQIRSAMRQLDEGFRMRFQEFGTGITYGIPGSALARIVEQVKAQGPSQQAEANDKFTAQTLAERLGKLASIYMLRMHVNVSPQIRTEARNIERNAFMRGRRGPAPRTDFVPLLPEHDARKLAQALESREVRDLEERLRQRLEDRVEEVTKSPHIADSTKRDLPMLLKKVKDAGQYAERPSGSYATYSTRVNGFSHDLKELLKRVGATLEVKGKS